MPFFYSVFVIWYNKTMFEERLGDSETWDEFFALCDQVQAEGMP